MFVCFAPSLPPLLPPASPPPSQPPLPSPPPFVTQIQPARAIPVPFFIKIQRNFRGCCQHASFETTPAPFVPRNLAKSFTLSTHCRDKACIRSYYLTIYNLASPRTKTGVKQRSKAHRLRASLQLRGCV